MKPTQGWMVAMASDVRLDEDHRYWLGSRELYSVTKIIDSQGLRPPIPEIAMEAAEAKSHVGTAVHHGAFMIIAGAKLKEVDERLIGYLSAVQSWWVAKQRVGYKLYAVEEMVYDDGYGYSGTLDNLLALNSRRALFDFKTRPWVEGDKYQLAAYAGAHFAMHGEEAVLTGTRAVVSLFPDGRWREHYFDDPLALDVFRSAAVVYAARVRDGLVS